ncbi:AAA+ family ATPase [Paracoccus sp. (in: a-proteobacteria)]|uniref:AAA+ family ATPase n=1 Tax=Paracoccus sp. TaxID=267 RepID=UPI0026DF6E39|nr:AAA+ family ATPase [Paracoccus sp. (in: a-proteobacteria)]MDO5648498.1 AAA+ family ATPase [Paracoccus sp. (in: a-proteobacteria)]
MKRLAVILALSLPPGAALAQDDGFDLIERGLGLLFQNLLDEIGPDLDDAARGLGGAMNRLAPAMQDLGVIMDDIRHYELPQRLDNGDILIRRRPDAPPPPPIGDDLRRLTPDIPLNPDAPQIEL